ncbi:hypothetical protein [Roseicella frigidaeris]|uniref:hypothetical protein n=1 Tax=Roseicella frigidaeris TaxID=2230885 RepID=UPI000FDE39E4|nr:hypothetical protein [Roseicella frigidaeris]
MDGRDLRRRMGWMRAEAAARRQAAPLRQRQPQLAPVTAEDCVRLGREPERRLEPLRRGTEARR